MTNNERNDRQGRNNDSGNSRQATSPRRLPVVRIDGQLYFVDERLRELRNVQNPHERLPIWRATGQPYVHLDELPRPTICEEDGESIPDPAPSSGKPFKQWQAEKRGQQANDGLRYLCIVCNKDLTGLDVEQGYAQCYACRHPKATLPKLVVDKNGRRWMMYASNKYGDTLMPLDAL